MGARCRGEQGGDPRRRGDRGRLDLRDHAAGADTGGADRADAHAREVVGAADQGDPPDADASRRPVVEGVDVRQQHEGVGPHDVRDERREPVVVAEPDLLGGDGVVLVDHRDDAEPEQAVEGAAGVRVVAAAHDVVRGQEHLPDGEAVPRERRRVARRRAGPGRRSPRPAGSPGRSAGGPAPSGASPAAMAPDETSTTSRPASRRAASTSTRAPSRASSMPPSRVVSDDEPTLTTTRCASARAARALTPGPRRPRRRVSRRSAPGRVRIGPDPGRALLGELVAGVPLGHAPGLVALAALLAGGATAFLQAQVAAARGGEHPGPGDQRRLPVEDDGVRVVADDDLRARDRAGLEQPLLDAEAGEPVGEVADRLVVAEVGLAHPALGLLAADAVADAVRLTGLLGAHGEAGLVDGPGPQDDARRGRAGPPPGPAATIAARANDSGRRPSWLTAETSNTARPALPRGPAAPSRPGPWRRARRPC